MFCSVAGESEKYKLKVIRYTSNSQAGDALKWHNGMKFSTPDRDNDVLLGKSHFSFVILYPLLPPFCFSVFTVSLNGTDDPQTVPRLLLLFWSYQYCQPVDASAANSLKSPSGNVSVFDYVPDENNTYSVILT